MKIIQFSKLLKKKSPQQIKEEYMLGKHSDLTDKQLEKVCELSGTGRGLVAFKYKKKVEKESDDKQTQV